MTARDDHAGRQAADGSELYGVWRSTDPRAAARRFTFGHLKGRTCRCNRLYETTHDLGECVIGPAKQHFAFVIRGAEDDREAFRYERRGEDLYLNGERFVPVPGADVEEELARHDEEPLAPG